MRVAAIGGMPGAWIGRWSLCFVMSTCLAASSADTPCFLSRLVSVHTSRRYAWK